jgi:hypothetical protein
MANKLQKKIFTALHNKKRRALDGSQIKAQDWETILEKSAYASLIPSLESLQVNAENQDATPEKLQQVFLNIIEILKKDYFNQELNRAKLTKHIENIHHQISADSSESIKNQILLNYINENKTAVVLLFINSQMTLAIKFSKLLINVIGRQIKNTIGFETTLSDNDNIVNQINDLIETCPDPKEATLDWLQEEFTKYQLENENSQVDLQAFEELTEPLLDLTNDSEELSENDLKNELAHVLSHGAIGNTFNQTHIAYYQKSTPLLKLLTKPITKRSIRKTYRNLYNILTKKLNIYESHKNNQLHEFIVAVIKSAVVENDSESHFTAEQVKVNCKRERNVQNDIIELCQTIKEQRKLIKSIISKLNQMPESTEVTIAKEFLIKKIESPLYIKIKKMINKIVKDKLYRANKAMVINFIKYIKSLVTQSVYECSAIVNISLKEPAIFEYFSLESLAQIKLHVINLSKYTLHSMVKRECSFLLHTLTFNEELTQQLQKMQSLYHADFGNVITYLIEPFENEQLMALTKAVNASTLASKELEEHLKSDNLSEIKIELLKYQEYLHALSILRLEAIQHTDDSSYNQRIDETYQHINSSYSKLYVIIDLIAIVGILPKDLMSAELKLIVDDMTSHLDDINSSFIYLSNIAHEFRFKTVDSKDIFQIRIIRGDFFHKKDHDLLSNASIAMLNNISPIELLEGLNEHFQRYNAEQKQECILFMENYIAYDTENILFNAINPERSELYNKLTTLVNHANESGIVTGRLIELMKQSIQRSKERLNNTIKDISNNTFTKIQLIRRINTINNTISENTFYLTKLDEYLTEISEIMRSANFQQFSLQEQSQLLGVFNDIKNQCKNAPFYNKWFDKLQKQLNAALLASSSSSVPKPLKSAKPHDNKMSFVEAIKNTVENENSQDFYKKMVIKFVHALESEFAILIQKIDISELRDLNWTRDEQRIKKDLNPLSPNVKLYHHYLDVAVQYISFLIFYHIDNNNIPKLHHDLIQVKQYYQFIENALTRALEMKSITAAYIIYKAIQSKPIKRLRIESKAAEAIYMSYLSKSKDSQIKLANIMRENAVVPLLPYIEQKLIFSYKKKYGSQFEFLSSAGRLLKYFESKKADIKSKTQNESIFSDMNYFLQKLNLLATDEEALDVIKSHRYLMKSSNDISPDISKKFTLSDFKSLSDLVKHLKLCQTRFIDHQFKTVNPENDIYEWLMSVIKNDNKFSYFSDAIETLFVLNEINQAQKRPYKRFHSHLAQILNFYQQKVASALKKTSDTNHNQLDYFFAQYIKMKRIRDIKDADESTFDMFSNLQNAKNVLKKFDEEYTFYLGILEQFEKSRSQAAYSQLLEDVLSGNSRKSLTLPTETDTKSLSNYQTLLPENEYDIPSAEPEHPDRIGINQTMSFTSNEQSSVLALFKTEELKMEFISAFPWAIQIDNIEKLNRMTFNQHVNLLGTPRMFSLPLQLAAMRFVLITLDSLGKIAGFSGQLTIQNFDRISAIINQLKWLTSQLKDAAIDEGSLLEQIKAVNQEMAFHNQEYFDMQQLYNPPFIVEDNPNMNGFCHLNEHLIYELTASEYEDSLLAPAQPAPPYLEKISQVIINHEKT